MKPTTPTIDRERSRTDRRAFPVTDFNYHSVAPGRSSGRCARTTGLSFRHISREYFETEANHYFLAEAAVFAAIMLTAAVPLVNGAHAVLHLARACGGY